MQERQEMKVQSLDPEDPLEQEIATHPSILAWEIPWTEEPGGPQFMEFQSQTRLSRRMKRWIYLFVIHFFSHSNIELFLVKNRQ